MKARLPIIPRNVRAVGEFREIIRSTQITPAFFRIAESDLQDVSHESSAFNRARILQEPEKL
jgi:hypothetical protein